MIRADERVRGGRAPRAAPAERPRRAAVRGAARRGRRPRRDRARDDGGRAAAVDVPLDGRHQGRRRLGVDDAADPRGRDRRRGRRAARRGAARADRRRRLAPMPELPEVETVARDLRPLIIGATIVGATTLWARTLRGDHDPRRSPTASPGGGSRRVGRRGKQLVDRRCRGDAALTIHLKMTGQLFVVPAGTAGGSVRPARPRARRRARDPVPRHPQVRQDRAVRRDPDGELARGRRRAFRGDRAGAARPTRSRVRAFRAPAPAPEGPAQAAPARPVVRRRRRQHLRRRGAVGGAPPPAADGPDAPPAGRAPPLRRRSARILAEAVERRGSSIDDYTAPDGDGEMQEHLDGLPADRRAVPALRPADPADRRRRRGRPTSARGASACRPPTGRAPGRSCGR